MSCQIHLYETTKNPFYITTDLTKPTGQQKIKQICTSRGRHIQKEQGKFDIKSHNCRQLYSRVRVLPHIMPVQKKY